MNMKWGLIGCGDISQKRVAPALVELDNSTLVSVARADYSKAEKFAHEFGAAKWFKDWQDLVKDEEIDAVYVSTPVFVHAEQTIAAAEAGKHVLCEKPMAIDRFDCGKMIDACKSNGVNFGIAYYRHFYPVVNRIKSIINSGEIGLPIYVLIKNHESFNCKPGEPRYWLLEKEKSGGGPMMDMGCHRIEVLLNLLGPLTDAKGTLTNVIYERDVEDTAIGNFLFANNSTAVIVSTHASSESQDTLEIWGCKGSVHVSSLNAGKMRIVNAAGERVEEIPPHANFHLPLIDDFVNAVAENREPGVTGEMGRKVTLALDKIYNR